MKITKRKWYPVASLEDKTNFKRMNRIDRDGSVTESVYLHVPDIRYREYLIFLHYIQHVVRTFIQDVVGMNILGRDDPWDFEVDLSNGSHFNVEITSIADNRQKFQNDKREERLQAAKQAERISLKELERLVEFFPNDEVANTVRSYLEEGCDREEDVPNPLYREGPNIVLSVVYETDDCLSTLLVDAIDRKAGKSHRNKEETVLIIDNRTGQYDLPDYHQALSEIDARIESWPFREIWFYTGYYSNHDGGNAEYSFAPIKVTQDQAKVLEEIQSDFDENGVYYSKWGRGT